MQPLFEHRLELAGYRTRVLELEGSGPPFVFMHGFADSADTWRLLLDRLARVERAAVAVDLPGFATASRLDRSEPILPQLDRFTEALVRHVAAEHGDVVLVGNSLGGCVALRAAENAELPIVAVVPVAPAGLDMARWLVVVESDPVMRALLRAPVPLPEPFVRSMIGQVYRRLAFARPFGVAGEVVRAFTAHHVDRASIAHVVATARRLLPELRDPFQFDRVAVPVVLVWGDRDALVSHRGAERVVAAVPGASFELIEDCGHCPQIEAVDRVVQVLLGCVEGRGRRVA